VVSTAASRAGVSTAVDFMAAGFMAVDFTAVDFTTDFTGMYS